MKSSGIYRQYVTALLAVLIVSVICFIAGETMSYQVVALILLATVSVLAMLLDIFPVLIACALSALIWNFLFIPPLFTFHIKNTSDTLMFSMYFLVAMINAVLSYKIKRVEKKARDKEEKGKTIKLYDTLLNSLSHELRTPIASIIAASDTFKNQHEQLNEETQKELLHQIETAGLRLNNQVENLLSMSRLESGMLRPKLDWCDTNELIYSVIAQFSDHEQRIVFNHSEQLPLFKTDRGLMEQVIHNLLHNAIHHTKEDSVITIESIENNGKWLLKVGDNGNGFNNNEMEFVFSKFYRNAGSKPGGIGLGLSIVKGLVEALNGNITANNKPKGGAEFIIIISAETSFIKNLKHE